MFKHGGRTVGSPLASEVIVRGDLTGRATLARRDELRADFNAGLENLLGPQVQPTQIVAIRAFDAGRVSQPEGIVVLSESAIAWLRASEGPIGNRCGVRAIALPFKRVVAVELSQRLLRGLFIAHASAQTRMEVPYSILDEALFAGLARSVLASIDCSV